MGANAAPLRCHDAPNGTAVPIASGAHRRVRRPRGPCDDSVVPDDPRRGAAFALSDRFPSDRWIHVIERARTDRYAQMLRPYIVAHVAHVAPTTPSSPSSPLRPRRHRRSATPSSPRRRLTPATTIPPSIDATAASRRLAGTLTPQPPLPSQWERGRAGKGRVAPTPAHGTG